MCPPLTRPRPNFFSLSNILYLTWVDSARCVLALFFEHKDNKSIECPECYSAKLGTDKVNYSGVLRHYIHFGNIPRYERCVSCNVIVAASHDILDCDTCSDHRADFLRYLSAHGLSPWTEPEATIVGISTTHL